MTAESSPPAAGTPQLSPQKIKGIHSALMRYRVMAWITGVFLATLTIALIVLWAKGYDSAQRAEIGWYNFGWTAHGFLYIVYLITTVDLFTRVRWRFASGILIALAGTIPFASFFAERWASNDVRRRFPPVEV